MRFVVVQIEDNEQAEAFVEAVRRDGVYFAQPTTEGEVQYTLSQGWEVPQVYAVPTKFCACAAPRPAEARTRRFGWYACTKCAKPRSGSMQHPFNLVERHKGAEDVAYYMGFRADRQPWRIKAEPKK